MKHTKTLDLKILYFTSIFVPFAAYISTDIFFVALIVWVANIIISEIYATHKKNEILFGKVFLNTSILAIMATIILKLVISA